MTLRIVDPPDSEEYSIEDIKASVDLRSVVVSDQPVREGRPSKMRCLWHDDSTPSLYVWPDHLHCFGCGIHMDLIEYVAWREGMDGVKWDFRKALALAAEYVGIAPRPPVVIERPKPVLSPLAADVAEDMYRRLGKRRKWFQERGLSDETIDREMLGYDRNAFAIPVWSDSGKLLTVRYRRDDEAANDKAGSKYWGIKGRNEPMLYNARALDLVEDWGWVAVCEGELDALRLYQEGIPAVSATNGAGALDCALADQIKRVGPGRVYVVYDQDEPGHVNGARVARLFGLRGYVLRWPLSLGKDVTEFLKGCSVQEFVMRMLDSVPPEILQSYFPDPSQNSVWR